MSEDSVVEGFSHLSSMLVGGDLMQKAQAFRHADDSGDFRIRVEAD